MYETKLTSPPNKRTPIVETNPQFLSMFYGDEFGNFIMAKEMPDNTFSLQRVIRKGKKTRIVWEHDKKDWYEKEQFSNKVLPADEAYNPKTRPWYTEALASKTHAWTD